MKSNLQSIIYNTWLNFVISLPTTLQRSGLKLLTVYTGDKDKLCTILFQVYKTGTNNTPQHPRIGAIIVYVKKMMKDADRHYTINQNLKYYIKESVNNESPNSVLAMLNQRTDSKGTKRQIQKI
jgi:hypothetical protein